MKSTGIDTFDLVGDWGRKSSAVSCPTSSNYKVDVPEKSRILRKSAYNFRYSKAVHLATVQVLCYHRL